MLVFVCVLTVVMIRSGDKHVSIKLFNMSIFVEVFVDFLKHILIFFMIFFKCTVHIEKKKKRRRKNYKIFIVKRGNHGFYDQPVLIIIIAVFYICVLVMHIFSCMHSCVWSVRWFALLFGRSRIHKNSTHVKMMRRRRRTWMNVCTLQRVRTGR